MEYTLRNLEARDIASVTTILSRIGIKEIKGLFQSETVQKLLTSTDEKEQINGGVEIGFEIAGLVLANYEKCQSDVFKLLASLSGKTVEEIASMPLPDFAEMVVAVIQQDGFMGFIKVVSKLFQ